MDGFVPSLVYALLHSLWQCGLLAGAAALTLRAMTRASAAWRHNVAMAFLLAMALTPAAQFIRAWQMDALHYGWLNLSAPGLFGEALVQDASLVATFVVAVWLVGVGITLARHIAGLATIASMERGPHQVLSLDWLQRVGRLRGALGIAHTVAVRLSDDVVTPCVTRLMRPIIWLPASMLTRMPADQLEALLAHEMAHIARKDWLWNGVQCLIETLLFYHPAVWWLGRRIRQEREHACDDLAVAAGGDAIALAEALASLEHDRRSAPQLSLAASGGSLLQRVTRLLSASPARGRWGVLAFVGALTISGALLFAQIGMTGGRPPDLQLTASTEGVLGRGDFRQIVANEDDMHRFYRASVDAEGRLMEVYRENGRAQPIDADVRAWLEAVLNQPLLQSADVSAAMR